MGLDVFLLALSIGLAAAGFNRALDSGEILERYGDLIARLPEGLNKPLGLCEKCFAGQAAFWVSLFYCPAYLPLVVFTAVCVAAIAGRFTR